MIKLVVGVDTLDEYAQIVEAQTVDYHGQPANVVWTRHKPKRAAELVQDGSIYRVIKSRIVCRTKILGFERVEDTPKGAMTLIMTEPTIIQTVAQPHRPFQGWRYFEPAKAPRDLGVYEGATDDAPPEDLAEDLAAAGLL